MGLIGAIAGAMALAAGSGGVAENHRTPEPLDVFGTWRTRGGDVLVAVFPDETGAACGQIVDIDEEFGQSPRPEDETVTPSMLANLSEEEREKMKSTPMAPKVGLPVLFGFEEGRTRWRNGFVFDTRTGSTYRAFLSRRDEESLAVTGCLGPFCRTQEWMLEEESLGGKEGTRCGTPFVEGEADRQG